MFVIADYQTLIDYSVLTLFSFSNLFTELATKKCASCHKFMFMVDPHYSLRTCLGLSCTLDSRCDECVGGCGCRLDNVVSRNFVQVVVFRCLLRPCWFYYMRSRVCESISCLSIRSFLDRRAPMKSQGFL